MPAPRTRHGSAHSRAKLSEDIVITIQGRMLRDGGTAARFPRMKRPVFDPS